MTTRRGGAPPLLRLLAALLLGLGGVFVVAAPAHADACAPVGSASPAALAAVQAACSEVGTMYAWGGGHATQPGKTHGICDASSGAPDDCHVVGFDCSGFVRWAWSVGAGRDILGPKEVSSASKIFENAPGLRLPAYVLDGNPPRPNLVIGDLTPGDLVFWKSGPRYWLSATHVAMWLGNNKIVESAESGTPVRVVDFFSHDPAHYVGALKVDTSGANSPDPDNSHLPGQLFSTWGTNVRVGDQPHRGSNLRHVFPGPTSVKISCQKHAENITAEGITNDVWSYLPGYQAWITNIYIRGPAILPGVPDCDTGAPMAGSGSGGQFSTWGTNVRIHADKTLASDVRATLAGPTAVRVSCQQHGDSVSAEGYVNNVWSYLPDYNGWITNIYIKGPAVLPDVPDCTGGGLPQASCTDNSTPTSAGARSPRTAQIWSRLIELRYSDTSECAWGRISNGSVGDEVWVDRTEDGGYSWDQLGYTRVTSGRSVFTTQFNDHIVKMRACGKAGDRVEIACTDWF